MKELTFTKTIQAPAQKVWEVLWNDDTYRKWTSHFNSSSYMKSNWEVGGKTLFLDGEGNGMISIIKELDPPFKVVFSHVGQIIKGREDTTSDEVKAFAGALEKYILTEENRVTDLTMSVETSHQFEQMMIDGFTKGIEDVKQLSEQL